MEPTPDDDAEHAAGIRWWVPWLAGFLASGASVVALSTVFPIAVAVLAGYGSAFGAAWQGRGRERPRVTRGHWAAAGFSVLMFTGLGLLLGAAGLSSNDGQRENAALGAVVGGLLLAVSGGAVLAMAIAVRRRRRRPTRSEE
ncbi:hypothetical protein [Curtobacterium sp. Leaf261]|uniref:hypothetical protein n=1 Tax=Curtobacterium sp. Leaf261 TaxID=1736311 RepID=UPI00070225BB|nr:hypothetical protein [Curtobacterium sp. Leaf261]KQO62708.1 hypothetical protein ASF23_07005 [Curtobacterium sp. Leaf261]